MKRATSVINFFLENLKITAGPELIARLKIDFLSFALIFFRRGEKILVCDTAKKL